MLKTNYCDLTGFVFNIFEKDHENHLNVFFTLSIPNEYINRHGNKVSEYDKIGCMLTSKKEEDGSLKRKSVKYFLDNFSDGKLVRVQGNIGSYVQGVVGGEIVHITDANKSHTNIIINRNILRVKEFGFQRKSSDSQQSTGSTIKEEELPDFEFPIYKEV